MIGLPPLADFGLAPSETSSTYHEVRLGSFPRRASKLDANEKAQVALSVYVFGAKQESIPRL